MNGLLPTKIVFSGLDGRSIVSDVVRKSVDVATGEIIYFCSAARRARRVTYPTTMLRNFFEGMTARGKHAALLLSKSVFSNVGYRAKICLPMRFAFCVLMRPIARRNTSSFKKLSTDWRC